MTTAHNAFPSSIHDELGYYVYRLIDPRNGETFYVGKGKRRPRFRARQGKFRAAIRVRCRAQARAD